MTDIEQQKDGTTVADDQQSISDIMDAVEGQENLKVTFPVTDNERTMLNFYKKYDPTIDARLEEAHQTLLLFAKSLPPDFAENFATAMNSAVCEQKRQKELTEVM